MTKTLMFASAGLAVLACAAAVVLPQPSVANAVAARFDQSMISGVADVLVATAAAPVYTLPTMTITAKRLTADEVAAIRAQDEVAVLPTMTITAKRLSAEEVAAIRAQDEGAQVLARN
jgi:uncharacterized membrane protein YhaH (DUF805 family)